MAEDRRTSGTFIEIRASSLKLQRLDENQEHGSYQRHQLQPYRPDDREVLTDATSRKQKKSSAAFQCQQRHK